jgi:hypothetical protein
MSLRPKMTPAERLFCGVYPGGLVFADRGREKGGDYARLAFMPYETLEARIEPDCPKDLRPLIEETVKGMQARRGEPFEISTCGQTVMLGSR